MERARIWLLSVGILAAIGFHVPTDAVALSEYATADARLRLDWQVGSRLGGHPVIQGWVYNDFGRPASDVRLLVESLDASGQPVGRTIGFVRGVVSFHDRTYFEVPIQTAGASYRVSITGFDWKGCGTGGA